MRLLVVNAPRADFLQDILYHGLATTLGAENVLEWPPNDRWHGGRPAELGPWDFPMLFFDFARPAAGELDDLLHEADAVVVTTLDDTVVGAVRRVVERRARPVVFIDGSDHFWIHGIARHVDAYCKREVLLRAPALEVKAPLRRLVHRIRRPPNWDDPLRRQIGVATAWHRGYVPMPLAAIDIGLEPAAEKEYDIAFLASSTSLLRKQVAKEVEALAGRGYRVAVGVNSPAKRPAWDDYMGVMTRTRLGLSVRGGGFDTYRYWETPYTGGVLVAETPRIVLPDNFVEGEEAFFAPVERLVETAVAVLERDDLEEVAARGREKALRSHTSVQRAERLLGVVERLVTRRRSS